MAQDREDWAGIPMPLEGEELVIEPTYPHAQALMAMCRTKFEDLPGGLEEYPLLNKKAAVRNSFWSSHLRSDIVIYERSDGRIDWGLIPGVHSIDKALRTLGCSAAWGLEQESKAQQLLGTLLSHHAFKSYLLTGSFLERSARSGVTYMFRRLRPTVAIVATPEGTSKILCTLCLHAVGYYADSWAGAMCPTDDVLAHLSMMRGDEQMFWRRANQHPAWRSASGL